MAILCKQCEVPLETASWEWEGTTFSREICKLCGFKSKAFVVSTQDSSPAPSQPHRPYTTLPATSTSQPPKQSKANGETQESKNIGYAMSYAKDLIVAEIPRTMETFNPAVKTIHYFRMIYREMANPFSTTYKEPVENQEIDFSKEVI